MGPGSSTQEAIEGGMTDMTDINIRGTWVSTNSLPIVLNPRLKNYPQPNLSSMPYSLPPITVEVENGSLQTDRFPLHAIGSCSTWMFIVGPRVKLPERISRLFQWPGIAPIPKRHLRILQYGDYGGLWLYTETSTINRRHISLNGIPLRITNLQGFLY